MSVSGKGAINFIYANAEDALSGAITGMIDVPDLEIRFLGRFGLPSNEMTDMPEPFDVAVEITEEGVKVLKSEGPAIFDLKSNTDGDFKLFDPEKRQIFFTAEKSFPGLKGMEGQIAAMFD